MPVRTFESVSYALTSGHSDPRTYTFIKENASWYIDLPEYLNQGGSKEDLQMRAGTNKLLTRLAAGRRQVTITIDTEPFEGAEVLQLVELCEAPRGGAIYLMQTCNGQQVGALLWICDIALFVFGDMPARMYVRKENHE